MGYCITLWQHLSCWTSPLNSLGFTILKGRWNLQKMSVLAFPSVWMSTDKQWASYRQQTPEKRYNINTLMISSNLAISIWGWPVTTPQLCRHGSKTMPLWSAKPMLSFGGCGSVSVSAKTETSENTSNLYFLPSPSITVLYHVTVADHR